MIRDKQSFFGMDPLESRTLLSGFGPCGGLGGFGGFGGMGGFAGFGHFGHGLRGVDTSDPTIQADLAQIKTDQQKLTDDRTALQSTLEADRQAVSTAINAVDVSAQRTALQTDIANWKATLQADWAQIIADKGDAAALATDKTKLQGDRTAAITAIKADADAIQTAINSDPAVQAAKLKLTTDSQPITDDQTALKADYTKLFQDIKTIKSGTTTDTGTTTTTATTAAAKVAKPGHKVKHGHKHLKH